MEDLKWFGFDFLVITWFLFLFWVFVGLLKLAAGYVFAMRIPLRVFSCLKPSLRSACFGLETRQKNIKDNNISDAILNEVITNDDFINRENHQQEDDLNTIKKDD